MNNLKLGPWPLGIDNLSPQTALPKGTVTDAVNLDLAREGVLSRRDGYTKQGVLEEGSGLWTSAAHGRSYCAANGVLYRVRMYPSFSITPIGSLGSSDTPSFCDLLDRVVVSTVAGCFTIDADDALVPLGVETPATPPMMADLSGGLAAGRYGVAFTALRGTEESGLSAIRFVDVAAGGGILMGVPTAPDQGVGKLRVYRTTPNGETLYAAAEVVAGAADFVLGNTSLGKQSDTIYQTKIRGGQIVRHWKGRLLVARGRTLLVSESMCYGLMSERHGFLQFPNRIDLVEPVEGGIYVGSSSGVIFVRGNGPADWTQQKVSGFAPVFGTGAQIPASSLDEELTKAANGFNVALWQSAEGYVIGLSDGRVLAPQASRLKLSPAKVGAVMVHQRRIISTEIM